VQGGVGGAVFFWVGGGGGWGVNRRGAGGGGGGGGEIRFFFFFLFPGIFLKPALGDGGCASPGGWGAGGGRRQGWGVRKKNFSAFYLAGGGGGLPRKTGGPPNFGRGVNFPPGVGFFKFCFTGGVLGGGGGRVRGCWHLFFRLFFTYFFRRGDKKKKKKIKKPNFLCPPLRAGVYLLGGLEGGGLSWLFCPNFLDLSFKNNGGGQRGPLNPPGGGSRVFLVALVSKPKSSLWGGEALKKTPNLFLKHQIWIQGGGLEKIVGRGTQKSKNIFFPFFFLCLFP